MTRSLLACCLVVAFALAGVLEPLNSPGPAQDPSKASVQGLQQMASIALGMHDRWWAMDAACDPDAIFGITYLLTTAKVGDEIAKGHFSDNGMLVEWDGEFAQRYFDAYDAYHSGAGAPGPWMKAFQYADSGDSTLGTDQLLGINAHVNYDLAFSTYAMGLPQAGNRADFDRVNDAFYQVVVPLADQMGARYDPGQARDKDGVSLSDEASLQVLIAWRDAAWENANLLWQTENDPLAHALVKQKILEEADAIADALIAGDGDSDFDRRAYCEASGHPPLPAELGGPGYGEHWDAWDDAVMDEGHVCHVPGKQPITLTVGEHAVDAHLRHGDHRGVC